MCDKCGNDHPDIDELIENADDRGLLFIALSSIGALVETFTESGYSDPDLYSALSVATKIAERLGIQELTDRFSLLKMETADALEQCGKENGIEQEVIDKILGRD